MARQALAADGVQVSAAFASIDANAHTVRRAVDVVDAQGAGFGDTQTGRIDGLKHGSVDRVRTAGKETGDLFSREEFGLLLRHAGHGRAQVGDIAGAPQHGLEQEAAGTGGVG